MRYMYTVLEKKAHYWGDGMTGVKLARLSYGIPLFNQAFWVREDELACFDTDESY